jgi:DNA-binding transcriptional MerR regulator
MFINKEDFEEWMKLIMERFDRMENKMEKSATSLQSVNGDKLLDNQDLCLMLNVSKRTLQRYRVSGLLPCKRFDQKTYYLESDVLKFIQEHLQKPTGKSGK